MAKKPSTPQKRGQNARFRELVRGAVTDTQIQEICAMLSNAAIKNGNIIAAKLLFNYLGGPPRAEDALSAPHGGARIYLPKVYEFERVNAPEPPDAASGQE